MPEEKSNSPSPTNKNDKRGSTVKNNPLLNIPGASASPARNRSITRSSFKIERSGSVNPPKDLTIKPRKSSSLTADHQTEKPSTNVIAKSTTLVEATVAPPTTPRHVPAVFIRPGGSSKTFDSPPGSHLVVDPRDTSQSHRKLSRAVNPAKKKKGVNVPHSEDPTMSLAESLTQSLDSMSVSSAMSSDEPFIFVSRDGEDEKKRAMPSANKFVEKKDENTLDIWLQKKGGDFDIFDGRLLVHPGNYHPKKDFITVKRITAGDRSKKIPALNRLEKINGDVYDFSTNKKLLKQPVDVWLPCHPIIHPNLQMIKLKALFKGEEEWVYHNWTLFGDDPLYPVMEFQTDRLGTFVATVEPRVERLTVTDQGLLYNAKLNKYISLRFPKKSVDHDVHIEIRILPFNMEKALIVKEEFRFQYPDLTDFEFATDYFEISSPEEVSQFKRSISVKIPTASEAFTEEFRDGIVIMRKDLETQQWHIVESNMKITKTTVSFDTKLLGRFVVLRAPAKRKMRMKNALPILESKMTKCRREFLIFKKVLKKSWNIWIELVKPSQVDNVISRRESQGIICISKPDIISTDLDGKPVYSIPVNKTSEPTAEHHNQLAMTESELEFTQQMGVAKAHSSEGFINIYDVESEENLAQPHKSQRKPSKRKSEPKKEYNYLEIDDGSHCGLIEVSGGIQQIDSTPLRPYFIEFHDDNIMTFEIEPKEADPDSDIEAVVKYYVENTSAADGLVTKTMMRECKFTFTPEQVADYFWVEPEPEPEPEPEEKVVLDPTLQAARDAAIKQEVLKSHQHKAKEQENTIARLSMPLKQKVMIYREPRVLSGRSLQTLSRMIEEGLTLAVYLDMPDSTITGIGFDALSNGLSLADVTYRILLRWKRSTKARGDHAVEELSNALRGMGRHDIVSIITDNHGKNLELTPSCFEGLNIDDENEEFDSSPSQSQTKITVKQFSF